MKEMNLRSDVQQTVTKLEEVRGKNEKASQEAKASIDSFREEVEQEIGHREKSNAELLAVEDMVTTCVTTTEITILTIQSDKKATEKETKEKETRKEETTKTRTREAEMRKELDKYKKLEEVRAKERREIESGRKREREQKAKKKVSSVCTSNVIIPKVFVPQGPEGACVDANGYLYDSWYGPIDCIKECKKACSRSINCVGFDVFNETMCETRYEAGRVPSTKPWAKAQGQWFGGKGKGPVKGVVEKGLADRVCFIKM